MNWKPKEQKELEGTYRSDRDTGSTVLNPLLQKPETPDKAFMLGAKGKKIYKRVCKILIEQGRLTTADKLLIELLSRCFEDYFAALQEITEKGIMVTSQNQGGNSYTHKNPAFTVKKESEDLIIKYCTQLGISPYARARLNLAISTGDDEAKDYLRESHKP